MVSSRRAIVLVLAEKAEPVDSAAEVVHAETISLPVPVVVRLTRYVRVPYPASVPLSRRAVFTRDGQTCVYCGGSATSIDHVVPAQPRRHPHLGQRRRRLPPVQPHQGRPVAGRDGLGAAAPAADAQRCGLAAAGRAHGRPALAGVARHARERERVKPGTS